MISINPLIVIVLLPVSLVVGAITALYIYRSNSLSAAVPIFAAAVIILLASTLVSVFSQKVYVYDYQKGEWKTYDAPQSISNFSNITAFISVLMLILNILVFFIKFLELLLGISIRGWG